MSIDSPSDALGRFELHGMDMARLEMARFEPLRLDALRKGQHAFVTGVDERAVATALPAGELERRMIEMGLVEGSRIEILHEGFPGRDPIAVRVNEHTLALRRAEARAVLVSTAR